MTYDAGMSSRRSLVALLIAATAGATAAACGSDSTVEGTVDPSTQAAAPVSASPTSTPFGEERPQEVTSPVTPPPAPAPAPAEGQAPAPGAPAEGQPAPAPAPLPGAGDFGAILGGHGITLPAGVDPAAVGGEVCARLDRGEDVAGITGWLGQTTGLDQEQQGFFLGGAVQTYCPQNFGRLG